MSNFLNLVSGDSKFHDKVKQLKIMREPKPISHTNTLNAIKAALGHHEDAIFMFSYYLRNPDKAKYILKIHGKPQRFAGQHWTLEGQTIKIHKIL